MTFAAPAFLPALLLLPGGVVLLYLIRRRRARLLHPTLMFLARAETVLDASRLSPRLAATLLFALDLALAALLAAALCRPGLARVFEGGRSAILLVDTSASMAAKGPGGTPLARALAQAGRVIGAMRAGDEACLMTLDRHLDLACPMTTDRAALAAALDRIAASDCPLDLDAARDARRLLGRETGEVAVLFLTDGAFPKETDLAAIADRVESFPGPFDNLGIAALAARRNADPAEGFDATLRIASSFPTTQEVDLELYGDGELADVRRVEAGPGLSEHRLLAVRMKPGLLMVGWPGSDALETDNRAWTLAAPDDRRYVRLKTEDPVTQAVFAALDDFSPAASDTGSVFVSDRLGATPAVALARLEFLPDGDANRPVAGLLAPEINPDHPITAGLESTEFLVHRGGYLAVPPGADVLIGSADSMRGAGPGAPKLDSGASGDECLAWVGPIDGKMTVRFGFAPANTNGARHAFLPLLIARAARYVGSYHARIETSGRTGDPFVLRGAGGPARVIAPDGGIHGFPDGNEIFFIHTARAGTYRIDAPGASLLLPLNLFSGEESTTRPRDVTGGTLPVRRVARAGVLDLTPALALLALLLAAAEWFVLRRSL